MRKGLRLHSDWGLYQGRPTQSIYGPLLPGSLTFASSEGGDLAGSGSDVVDDGILNPGNPKDSDTRQTLVKDR